MAMTEAIFFLYKLLFSGKTLRIILVEGNPFCRVGSDLGVVKPNSTAQFPPHGLRALLGEEEKTQHKVTSPPSPEIIRNQLINE